MFRFGLEEQDKLLDPKFNAEWCGWCHGEYLRSTARPVLAKWLQADPQLIAAPWMKASSILGSELLGLGWGLGEPQNHMEPLGRWYSVILLKGKLYLWPLLWRKRIGRYWTTLHAEMLLTAAISSLSRGRWTSRRTRLSQVLTQVLGSSSQFRGVPGIDWMHLSFVRFD